MCISKFLRQSSLLSVKTGGPSLVPRGFDGVYQCAGGPFPEGHSLCPQGLGNPAYRTLHVPLWVACKAASRNSPLPSPSLGRCFNEAACISVPPVDGYVMVLQPEEPKVSLSGVHHFARAASEFESPEGVFLFPELRIISTITREVEPEGEGDEDPTGNSSPAWDSHPHPGSNPGWVGG